jgi:hypothetical protein
MCNYSFLSEWKLIVKHCTKVSVVFSDQVGVYKKMNKCQRENMKIFYGSAFSDLPGKGPI